MADHAEIIETQVIGERGDIPRPIAEAAAGLKVGTAETGSVGGDQTEPVATGRGVREGALQTTAGGSVEIEDRKARRVAPIEKGQLTPIRQHEQIEGVPAVVRWNVETRRAVRVLSLRKTCPRRRNQRTSKTP